MPGLGDPGFREKDTEMGEERQNHPGSAKINRLTAHDGRRDLSVQ